MFTDVINNGEELIYTNTILDAATPNLTNNYILRIWVHNNGSAQSGDNVVVPKKIGSIAVTGLGSYSDNGDGSPVVAFTKTIKSIVLNDNIKFINGNTFVTLTTDYLVLPEGLVEIPFSTTYRNNLSFIAIPETVKAIAYIYADNIILPSSITFTSEIYSDNIILMDGIYSTGINDAAFFAGKQQIIEIPKSVTSISHYYQDFFYSSDINNKTIILRNSQIPSGFSDTWNCTYWDYDYNTYENICTKNLMFYCGHNKEMHK